MLLKELSTIGKIENERYNAESVDIKTLVEEIKLSIADKINSSKATFILDLKVSHIHFSKRNLRSILYNLIVNSIKYQGEKRIPEIHIATSQQEDFVSLSVKDNGIGMSPEEITKVFTIYKKLKQDTEGQGLGLYLVKKVVDAAGGKIHVESEPGLGTTIEIFFKAKQ
jgi:two-component system CheB/CheR fusion protein